MRLCQFLMQDESFPISHAGWDFLVFSLKMRFSHILIQDETFPISHAGWDFSVFLCYMRLFVRGMKNKKNTLLRPLHYVLAVKKLWPNHATFNFNCVVLAGERLLILTILQYFRKMQRALLISIISHPIVNMSYVCHCGLW